MDISGTWSQSNPVISEVPPLEPINIPFSTPLWNALPETSSDVPDEPSVLSSPRCSSPTNTTTSTNTITIDTPVEPAKPSIELPNLPTKSSDSPNDPADPAIEPVHPHIEPTNPHIETAKLSIARINPPMESTSSSIELNGPPIKSTHQFVESVVPPNKPASTRIEPSHSPNPVPQPRRGGLLFAGQRSLAIQAQKAWLRHYEAQASRLDPVLYYHDAEPGWVTGPTKPASRVYLNDSDQTK